MSYGYMLFLKQPSKVVKTRYYTFDPLCDRGGYKVFSRLFVGCYGIVNDYEYGNFISEDGEQFLLKLYDEVGSFFFAYFLLTSRMGDEDMADRLYKLIQQGKAGACPIVQGEVIELDMPYLLSGPKPGHVDNEHQKTKKMKHHRKRKKTK